MYVYMYLFISEERESSTTPSHQLEHGLRLTEGPLRATSASVGDVCLAPARIARKDTSHRIASGKLPELRLTIVVSLDFAAMGIRGELA